MHWLMTVLCMCGIGGPASGPYEPAVRLDPPPPPVTAPQFTDDCDEAEHYRAKWGLPASFDRIIWRESNCRLEPGVRTSCCVGWLQLNANLHVRDHRLRDSYAWCGVYSNADVDGPGDEDRHMCAARQLYNLLGTQPWSL